MPRTARAQRHRAAVQMDRDAITSLNAKARRSAMCAKVTYQDDQATIRCPKRASYSTPHGLRCAEHAGPTSSTPEEAHR